MTQLTLTSSGLSDHAPADPSALAERLDNNHMGANASSRLLENVFTIQS